MRELENLVRIGQLKPEPRQVAEFKRLLEMARTRLADAQLDRVSQEGRFTSAYNAAHAAALAALRWHGYRSENRYTVFQCLAHTVAWPASRWRVLDAAHQKRNLAEYEGFFGSGGVHNPRAVHVGDRVDRRCAKHGAAPMRSQ